MYKVTDPANKIPEYEFLLVPETVVVSTPVVVAVVAQQVLPHSSRLSSPAARVGSGEGGTGDPTTPGDRSTRIVDGTRSSPLRLLSR